MTVLIETWDDVICAPDPRAVCPHCGGEIDASPRFYSVGSISVTVTGAVEPVVLHESLRQRERELFAALARWYPRPAHYSQLVPRGWTDDADGRHWVRVNVCRLRGRLAPYGVAIASISRWGYRLEVC